MSEYSLKRFINRTKKLNLYIQKYRLNKELPFYLHQVLIGILLSDASIERLSKTGAARLSIILSESALPYINYLFALFRPYIDRDLSFINVKNNKINKNYSTVRFKTAMLPIFVDYHKMFYSFDEELNKYVKIMPKNIGDLLTPVSLAHLIMGDGNLKKDDNIIRIYTNSFKKLEVEMLASVITSKLNINSKVVLDRNSQYIIIINKSQLNKVRTLIESHIHPNMLYKLGLSLEHSKFNLEEILGQVKL